jgi:hypothetical protein
MQSTGTQAGGGSPDDFRKLIVEELIKWREIVKITGVTME